MIKENVYSQPTETCRHPEHWTTSNAGTTELEVSELFCGLVRGLQPEFVVELGTFQGEMSQRIGETLKRNGHGRLETIEWNHDYVLLAMKVVVGLPVSILEGDVHEYHQKALGKIDLVWVDADVAGVEAIDSLFPHFRKGTILGIHDSRRSDIRGALERLAHLPDLKVIELPTPRGVFLAEVII